MARINLLPWRAERRKARQKEFVGMLGLAALCGVLVSFLIVSWYSGRISQRSTTQPSAAHTTSASGNAVTSGQPHCCTVTTA